MHQTFFFNHDLQTVFELLTDPDFLVQRAIALGDMEAECELDESAEMIHIRMTRKISRELPGFLKKLFSSQQVVELDEKWHSHDDDKSGSFMITVQGQPIVVEARFTLRPTDGGCEYCFEHSAKARFPLIAGKIEQFINTHTESEVRREIAYAQRQLMINSQAG